MNPFNKSLHGKLLKGNMFLMIGGLLMIAAILFASGCISPAQIYYKTGSSYGGTISFTDAPHDTLTMCGFAVANSPSNPETYFEIEAKTLRDSSKGYMSVPGQITEAQCARIGGEVFKAWHSVGWKCINIKAIPDYVTDDSGNMRTAVCSASSSGVICTISGVTASTVPACISLHYDAIGGIPEPVQPIPEPVSPVPTPSPVSPVPVPVQRSLFQILADGWNAIINWFRGLSA
jgi:hypothetical protein